MSAFIFYKVPFEGKIKLVYNLIKTNDWKVSIKIPEQETLLMKIPSDFDEEISFYEGIVFDEKTNSKFGSFETITEQEFESAQSIDIPDLSGPEENENEQRSKKIEEINQKIQSKISFGNDNKENGNILEKKESLNKLGSLLGTNFNLNENLPSSIDFKEIGKLITETYKDPYDYFFTHNYLIVIFSFAVICLMIFNF